MQARNASTLFKYKLLELWLQHLSEKPLQGCALVQQGSLAVRLSNCRILQSQPAQTEMLLLAAGNGQGVGRSWYQGQC